MRNDPLKIALLLSNFLDIKIGPYEMEKVLEFVDKDVHTWKLENNELIPIYPMEKI
jgi:hypothetical protein